MRLRLAAVILTASVVSAASAQAQSSFKFTAVSATTGSTTAWGYSIGNYSGQETFGSVTNNVTLDCVDFFHHVAVGDTWEANLTSLASGASSTLSNTRNTSASALNLYREAAFLATQYNSASVNSADIQNIQLTIWNLFAAPPACSASVTTDCLNATNGSLFATGGTQLSGYWKTFADAHYADDMSIYNGYYVVTDKAGVNGKQEFVMKNPLVASNGLVTPEPASLVLLGTGLLGLAGFKRMRRKA